MNIFFDSEFTGLHQNTTLISIGLVAEDERTFYAELVDYDQGQVDGWIQENVIARLQFDPSDRDTGFTDPLTEHRFTMKGDRYLVGEYLAKWLSQFGQVQMVSDCLSYDWVLFCQLWGHAFNIPENVSPAPRDINQDIADYLGISEREAFNDVNREKFAFGEYLEEMKRQKHNALWDTRVIKACYEKLSRKAGND